jgi:hypothetical protein
VKELPGAPPQLCCHEQNTSVLRYLPRPLGTHETFSPLSQTNPVVPTTRRPNQIKGTRECFTQAIMTTRVEKATSVRHTLTQDNSGTRKARNCESKTKLNRYSAYRICFYFNLPQREIHSCKADETIKHGSSVCSPHKHKNKIRALCLYLSHNSCQIRFPVRCSRTSVRNTGWAVSRLTLVRDLNAFLSSDLWPTLYYKTSEVNVYCEVYVI